MSQLYELSSEMSSAVIVEALDVDEEDVECATFVVDQIKILFPEVYPPLFEAAVRKNKAEQQQARRMVDDLVEVFGCLGMVAPGNA